MKYKVGQILVSTEDVEVEKALSGEKVVIPKGNKIIVGPDKLAHHIRTGMKQQMPEDAEIDGYDANGLASYLYLYLRNHFEIDEMLEGYDDTKENFIEEIEFALEEIGF
ncbi:MAG: hypothetical protein IJZ79_02325 [Bacilli bacterium]|nr:hypothetical protein [Bacilli bacterium]